ncbi:hypothetical protein BU15DRAFT_84427, partial [Melanogaster broomeanus]
LPLSRRTIPRRAAWRWTADERYVAERGSYAEYIDGIRGHSAFLVLFVSLVDCISLGVRPTSLVNRIPVHLALLTQPNRNVDAKTLHVTRRLFLGENLKLVGALDQNWVPAPVPSPQVYSPPPLSIPPNTDSSVRLPESTSVLSRLPSARVPYPSYAISQKATTDEF